MKLVMHTPLNFKHKCIFTHYLSRVTCTSNVNISTRQILAASWSEHQCIFEVNNRRASPLPFIYVFTITSMHPHDLSMT